MEKVKVIRVNDGLVFDNGVMLFSDHQQNCCEQHYLSFEHLSLLDFEGLEFDLSNDDFFERIDGYGIALKPLNGWPIRIPGYGSNNGYYSSHIDLILEDKDYEEIKRYDISECQDY